MAGHKSPLRDRLTSNSPDLMKTSILREAGMGWSSPPSNSTDTSNSTGSITSPLRIAKREAPIRPRQPELARRSSSSYRHVRNNNLVSKSPFKSQIPTPSTPSRSIAFPSSPRRVSGEKRPRPSSMHDQAENENERPFALKRERKQSKTYQGLIQKEPVTKSPFRRTPSVEETLPPPPPPPPFPISRIPASSFPPSPNSRIPTPTSNGASPTRSCLVSRRMHGPRLSGGRRERRKTVIFDERCDVLEFDREEGESDMDDSADEDDYGDDQDPDPFFQRPNSPPQENEDNMTEESSYESIQLSDIGNDAPPLMNVDPDTSITGLVEEIFASNTARPDSGITTPPRQHDIPTDLETDDGVPFGRTHHVERFIQHHQLQQQSPRPTPPHSYNASPQQPSLSYPSNLNLPTHASPQGPPATPPRPVPGTSTPPLGRSTHIERVRAARDEKQDSDVGQLPVSPSPHKKLANNVRLDGESLIPRFGVVAGPRGQSESEAVEADPFVLPSLKDEPLPPINHESHYIEGDDSMDPANLSIGHSEVSLSEFRLPDESEDAQDSPQPSPITQEYSQPPLDDGSREGMPPERGSPNDHDTQAGKPSSPVAQPVLSPKHIVSPPGSRNNSPGPIGSNRIGVRPRISKDDVKKRLLRRRSFGSPSPSPSPDVSQVPDPAVIQEVHEKPAETPHEPPVETSVEVQIETPLEDDAMEEDYGRDVPDFSQSEKERDRMSVITTATDLSTETATIEKVEKFKISAMGKAPSAADGEFGFLGVQERLNLDFGSKFGQGGLDIGSLAGSASSRNDSNLHQASTGPEIIMGSVNSGASSSLRMGDVDVDMDMKSALDRLMEDVAGTHVENSMITDEGDSFDPASNKALSTDPRPMERAATDLALLGNGNGNGFISRNVSSSSTLSVPPPVPPKDNIKSREALILEKRREARRLEEDSEADDVKPLATGRGRQNLGVGRPSRRRSMSTGDAEVLGGGAKRRGDALLDVKVDQTPIEDPLGDSIERELKKLDPPNKTKYHVREHEGTIYASSDADRISHMAGPGDVNAGKAWRAVRRPSDMNEYSKQIKEYRAQEKPGKAYGKVFVKVVGLKGIHLPLPQQSTAITCTLNNGIHFVTTPECQLSRDCRIEQEFELIEHSKLEFTLTLKIRRDPHIIAQFKSLIPSPAPPPPPPPPVVQTSSKGGMRSFFSSSPKKSSKEKISPPPAPQPPIHRLPENLARYLKPDGTLARAFISFKDVAPRCDTRLFETTFPLIGQRVEVGNKFSTLQAGEIVLQMFRLPPLPGIPPDQLPQSLEDCHRGLRHINWHKVTYFEGILTQNGGDCSTWRRRQLRVIGSNLVAFNDVTKKATATIDLKKAIAVEDDQEARSNALSPALRIRDHSRRYADDYDGLYGVERSFRLIFPHKQEIVFFADTDEEKARWLDVLRALVGHIPPHPLWAELLWQRQDELTKRSQPSRPGQPLASSHSSGPQH